MRKPALLLLMLSAALVALPVFPPLHARSPMDAGKSAHPEAGDVSRRAADTQMHRISSIMGREIRGKSGEVLGVIDNLVIGPNGYADFIILSTSGPNAVGEKLVPLPWEVVATPAGGGVFTTAITDRILKGAPSFDRDNWPDLTSSEWERTIYSYYGMPGETDYPQIARAYGGPAPISMQRRGDDVSPPPKSVTVPLHRLAEYLGQDVLSKGGEKLGEVDDFVFDPSFGRVTYAILSVGNILGENKDDKEIAAPWRAITLKDGKLSLRNMDREKLADAPSFSREDRPDFTDREWESSIHSYFGEKPYWIDEDPAENKG